jgi:response regulator NasT
MFLSAFSDDQTVEQVKALGAVAYLVKPLDIGQIVPTVESVFARLGDARAPSPAPAAAGASDALADPVPVAVGILMHRYSLPRAEALLRLQRLAAAEGRPLPLQAQRVVEAVETLAGREGP